MLPGHELPCPPKSTNLTNLSSCVRRERKTGGVYAREKGSVPSPDVLRKQRKLPSLIREIRDEARE